jgi:hypothetical protein
MQKGVEDCYMKFFSSVTADNYEDKSAVLEEDVVHHQNFLYPLLELHKMTDEVAQKYIEDEANTIEFMDRYRMSEIFEGYKTAFKTLSYVISYLKFMGFSERGREILHNLTFDVAMAKVYRMQSESKNLPLLISDIYDIRKYENFKEKKIFKPSLPYKIGSVIATVDLIVACEALDLSQTKNYIIWSFEGCLNDEAIDWKTKYFQLLR